MTEISLELLVGRMVRTPDGEDLGRIQEIRASNDGEITEFLVGKRGLAERLSSIGLFTHTPSGYLVNWWQMDLADPEKPAVNCDVTELRRL
ncbi:MAG TPA: PRC-barrel domain-containing protein [Bryobacteraceae bacterium]|nr:PRC-barrel domain-containing protein [Bryobacteraceae bacterium]